MRTNPSLADLCQRIEALAARQPATRQPWQRVIVGIVGAPGSGKTTLAEALVAAMLSRFPLDPESVGSPPAPVPRPWIGSPVAHVPMDGFHLADVELRRLGRAERKGAPDTFDPAGYAALLQRLRSSSADVWAPAFDREIEQPIAGSIPVQSAARVIITEGNYLLLDDPLWRAAREELDEVWFCQLDGHVRRERLIARHIRFGKTPAAARQWAAGPDQRNADLIEATRARADLVITEIIDDPPPP